MRAYPQGTAFADEGNLIKLVARMHLPKMSEKKRGQLELIGFVDTGSEISTKTLSLISTIEETIMKNASKPSSILALAVGCVFFGASPAWSAPVLKPDLASFAVLGASGVTNVPISTIGGNLGSSANPSVGGGYIFTAGSLQQNTAIAQQAQLDLDTAILTLNGMANTTGTGITPLSADLVGLTLAPGVYDVLSGTTNLSGLLTLDGRGTSDAVWVFRFASTLITSEGSDVNVLGDADSSGFGIYWSVGTAATLNGDTFAGNVLARDLISSNGGLTLGCGRLLSADKQVTLNKDTISIGCGAFGDTGFGSGGFDQRADIGSGGTGGSNGQVVNGVPEPGSMALLGLGLGALGFIRRRS